MLSVLDKDDVSKAIALAASRLGYVQLYKAGANKTMREFVHASDYFVSLILTGSGKLSVCVPS